MWEPGKQWGGSEDVKARPSRLGNTAPHDPIDWSARHGAGGAVDDCCNSRQSKSVPVSAPRRWSTISLSMQVGESDGGRVLPPARHGCLAAALLVFYQPGLAPKNGFLKSIPLSSSRRARRFGLDHSPLLSNRPLDTPPYSRHEERGRSDSGRCHSYCPGYPNRS